MDKPIKDLVKAAKDFAKTKNRGLSSRIREKIDEMKPAIMVLVNERLSINEIQEFISKETGIKIGIAALRQYCQDTFNYPPIKKNSGKDSGGNN